MQFFPHAEGYVKANGIVGRNGSISYYQYNYVFNYTDHLGNVRLSYALDPNDNVTLKILEENHYYPFGLKHQNYNVGKLDFETFPETGVEIVPTDNPMYKYKYNGKELQEELGLNMYDYGARNYDPSIGRFFNVDPKAETSRRWNTYNYCYNNPMRFIDPDGMKAFDLILKGGETAVNKTITTMNDGLGGKYASVDEKGKVSLKISEEQKKNLTPNQLGLLNVISESVYSPEETKIEVKLSDKNVIAGDYSGGVIDINDINAFGDGELMNRFSVLGHELKEQYNFQVMKNVDYTNDCNDGCHNIGSATESTINGGWVRGISDVKAKDSTFIKEKHGGREFYAKNYTSTVPFTNSKKHKAYFKFTVVEGNVVKK